jgi:hypothetical protein
MLLIGFAGVGFVPSRAHIETTMSMRLMPKAPENLVFFGLT